MLLLILVVLSCTSGSSFVRGTAQPESAELGANELAAEQRRSLGYVFYRGNDMPPPPTEGELERLARDMAEGPTVEVEELRALFGAEDELLVYATRDTDADGVLDYRISEYRGKFFEGDIDLDGDGIRNVYDSEPYDPRVGGVDTDGDGVPDKPGSFADRDGDGIPNHLDWSRRKPAPLPELQANLFRDYGVILVERSARFSPQLVRAADDTIRLVFGQRLPTLRTLAVEDQLLISPDLGDNGFMLAQTQTLTVYTRSLEGASPLVLFGLLIHEVGHAWQLAQDFDEGALEGENKKMHFPPGRFTAQLERFGWKVDPTSPGDGYHHAMYQPHFYATSPRYLYRGNSSKEWKRWFDEVRREAGPDFLRNSPAVSWGMVGPYSLSSPWEWHADHLLASVYNRLEERMSEHDNQIIVGMSGLLGTRMLESVQRQWSRFDYRNAVGTSIDRQLARAFVLDEREADQLIDRYVLPLVDVPVVSEALASAMARQAQIVDTDEVRDTLNASWGELREQVSNAALLDPPNLHLLARAGTGPWRKDEARGEVGGGGDLDFLEVGEEAGGAGEGGDLDGALLDGQPGTAELGDDSLLAARAGVAETPRLGLTHSRHGAGRVGGTPHDEVTALGLGAAMGEAATGEATSPEEGSPEGDARPLAEADDEDGASVDAQDEGGRGVAPVVSLFEELRRMVPTGMEDAPSEIGAPVPAVEAEAEARLVTAPGNEEDEVEVSIKPKRPERRRRRRREPPPVDLPDAEPADAPAGP